LYFAGTDDFRGAELWAYRPASNQMLLLRSVKPEICCGAAASGLTARTSTIRSRSTSPPAPGTFTIYWDSAASTTYKFAEVTGISIRGQGGNDQITINGVLAHVTIARRGGR
jgi:hypothetical protein